MWPHILASIASKSNVTQETVSLSGTLVAPESVISFALSPNNAKCTWLFSATITGPPSNIRKGKTMRASWINDEAAVYTSANSETDWVIPANFQNGPYYIRATLEADDAPNLIGSDSLDTWHSLTNGVNTVIWGWEATGAFETKAGTLKVEISTDVSGTPIVATGYYRGSAETEI